MDITFKPDEINAQLAPFQAYAFAHRHRPWRSATADLAGTEHHWRVLHPAASIPPLRRWMRLAHAREIEAPAP